jgi:DNA-binding CsgD family transcriptional regulator
MTEASVVAATEAFARGDIDGARQELLRHLEAHEDPDARCLLAAVAYADDDFASARRNLEQAFGSYRTAGQSCRAARVAIDLAGLHVDVLGNDAAGRGWVERARRLLEAVGPCVEWGWFELAVMACDRPDIDDLERSTQRALRIASEYGEPNLEVQALADYGLALVTRGRTAEGFHRLDEALAAITAGEVKDLRVAGKCFCAMLASCDRAADIRRAEEWTRLIDEMLLSRLDDRPRILHTHCRAAYGSVLWTVGRWSEAEAVMLEALGPRASAAFGHRVETVARLAELRVQQGRLEEAGELLAPFEDTLVVSTALACLHLASARPDLAVAVARRAQKARPGDVLRGAPLLGIVVEGSLACDDPDTAEAAAAELDAMNTRVEHDVVAAEAALASARIAVAHNDVPRAVDAFERARAHYETGGRRFAVGLVGLELGELLAADEQAAAVSEARAARSLFERLGAAGHVDRADALLRALGARGPRRVTPESAVGSLTPREREALDLVRQGLTNGEIAKRLFISTKTAEHHVGSVLAKLGVRSRAEAAAVATVASSTGDGSQK